ncbi:hypothetical protein AVEN_26884-1 [Araneus ventricosus]|uniref:Uncharacterized protein n=1 Tax=Araneus ventricosus TaxID=182803 RepID=A0A4Y2V6L0_ARAVE|nr:hypothetical protein AVEN_26884-1 [Araneus ventricosus]
MTTTWSTTYVVGKCNVMWKLPHPVLTGGSERQLQKLTFGIDLSNYNNSVISCLLNEILDDISKKTTNITLGLGPKLFSLITSEICVEEKSDERDVKEDNPGTPPEANKQKSASEISDCYFYERQSEMELPILEFEAAKLQYMQWIGSSDELHGPLQNAKLVTTNVAF